MHGTQYNIPLDSMRWDNGRLWCTPALLVVGRMHHPSPLILPLVLARLRGTWRRGKGIRWHAFRWAGWCCKRPGACWVCIHCCATPAGPGEIKPPSGFARTEGAGKRTLQVLLMPSMLPALRAKSDTGFCSKHVLHGRPAPAIMRMGWQTVSREWRASA